MIIKYCFLTVADHKNTKYIFILCIYISSYFGLNIINEILCAGDDNVKEAKDLVKVQSVDNNNKTTY